MAPVPRAGNRDSPNKSKELTSMDAPDLVINADSSSSDDDEAGFSHQGYELLPQDAGVSSPHFPPSSVPHNHTSLPELDDVDTVVMDTLDADDGPQAGGSSLFDVSSVKNSEAAERRAVWGGPTSHHTKMSQAEADQIRSALSGFSLPAAHMPDWAQVVSEDEWKAQLLSRLSQPITSHQTNSCQPIRDAAVSKGKSSPPITVGVTKDSKLEQPITKPEESEGTTGFSENHNKR